MAVPKENNGIKIEGGPVNKAAVDALAGGVAKIFESGHKNHMEQDTVQEGLKVLAQLGTVHDISIQGATISNIGD